MDPGPVALDPRELDLLDNLQACREPEARKDAAARIAYAYHDWMATWDGENTSPDLAGRRRGAGRRNSGHCASRDGPIERYIPTLLRLSLDCPYEDIRTTMRDLLDQICAWGRVAVPQVTTSPVSTFIPAQEVVGLGTDKDAASAEFREAFQSDGRVSHMTQIMAFHPEYLKAFRVAHNYQLWGEGPLDFAVRHLLAVMAASRHKCAYLINIHSQHFRQLGGNAAWLEGSEHLPAKLQHILELNSLLAHSPWLITQGHIERLVKAEEHKWSLPELLSCISILTHFHALCGFVFGCGIASEIDFSHVATSSAAAECKSDEAESAAAAAAAAAAKAAKPIAPVLQGRAAIIELLLNAPAQEEDKEVEEAENMHNFAEADPQVGGAARILLSDDAGRDEPPPLSDQDQPEFDAPGLEGHAYANFDIKNIPPLKLQSFTWADHGFSTFHRFLPDCADLIDAQLTASKELTYERIGDERVDTHKLRSAIWNYVYRTKGIINDGYNYGQVNYLLDRRIKGFVKTVACLPELVTKGQYDGFVQLQHSEKVHVCLLAMDARRESELLFAVKAVMEFLT